MDFSVESEYDGIDLGDKRLNKRAKTILNKMASSPGRTIPQNFKTWSEIKACYRFLNNDNVTHSKILQPHKKRALTRIKKESTVLCINDTTSVNYTSKKSMEGKGSIGVNSDGFWIHPLIAVTPERLNLGVLDVNFFTRKKDENKKHRNKQSIEQKESFRWLTSYRITNDLAKEMSENHFIYVADRESDIIELINEALDEKMKGEPYADIIIRSQHDRLIDEFEENSKEQMRIRQKLKESKSLGTCTFIMPTTHGRQKRKVTQEIRSVSVILKPHEKSNKRQSPITINFVIAEETLESAQGEEPLTWIIITTLPASNYEEACLVLEYYLCRWEIEIFFKVLKSGCKAEERNLGSAENMKNLISILMILSWRIMFIMMLGRNYPEISCESVFDESEWKSVFKIIRKNGSLPTKPPTLQEMIIMIAILGGYITGKSAPPPGITVIWRGMLRMYDFALAWEAFSS